jgi:nucleotide-binding universal stress UspA family protein
MAGGVAETVADYALEIEADLLVMGAYGHSRFREFVLGGATRKILSDPPLPVFLSH